MSDTATMENEKTFEAGIGWGFMEACALLRKGIDPRDYDMAYLLPDANADFDDRPRPGTVYGHNPAA